MQPDDQPVHRRRHQLRSDIDPAITAEFAHTVYRFGHSMLSETVARTNPDGTPDDIPLLEAFLNPLAFNDDNTLSAAAAAGRIFQGRTRQVGNEIDEFITEALRNNLLGLPLDLAAINIDARPQRGHPGAERGSPRLLRRVRGLGACGPTRTGSSSARAIKHPESLVNFIAAYGIHPTLDAATTLADRRLAAEPLAVDPAFLTAPAADSRRRADRPLGGRPGREAEPVRRPPRLDLQLGVRDTARGAAERRPVLLPRTPGRPEPALPARGELLRRADHAQHRRARAAGRRVLAAGPGAQPRQPGRRRRGNPGRPHDAGHQRGDRRRARRARCPAGPTAPPSTRAARTSCGTAAPGTDIVVSSEGDDTIQGNERQRPPRGRRRQRPDHRRRTATTSSPTPSATTCSRAARGTTPSAAARGPSTCSRATRATTSSSGASTSRRSSAAPATTSSTWARG